MLIADSSIYIEIDRLLLTSRQRWLYALSHLDHLMLDFSPCFTYAFQDASCRGIDVKLTASAEADSVRRPRTLLAECCLGEAR